MSTAPASKLFLVAAGTITPVLPSEPITSKKTYRNTYVGHTILNTQIGHMIHCVACAGTAEIMAAKTLRRSSPQFDNGHLEVMTQLTKFRIQYTCSDAGSSSSTIPHLMAHVLKKNAQRTTLVQAYDTISGCV